MESDHLEAHEAMAAIDAGRAAAAAAIQPPRWYYPSMAVIVAALAFTIGAQPHGTTFWSSMLVLVVLVLNRTVLMPRYRARTGIWLTGLEGGRAALWSLAWLAVCAVVLIGATKLHDATGGLWPAAVAAAILLVATMAYGRLYTKALRRRLLRPIARAA